jgi:uncharacterized protein (DUF433 family)
LRDLLMHMAISGLFREDVAREYNLTRDDIRAALAKHSRCGKAACSGGGFPKR